MTETINKTIINNYSLNSIAGYEDEKEEAIRIINLFKNFDKLKSMGVSIPRGLILSGEPGVGKTLMAKVIAAEAKVPFYEYEATEDDTPKKAIANLKKIYEEARKNSPSIVFIDELDEIVLTDDFISDVSRSMLKTLLTEIDGVKSSEGVLTIATTNHYGKVPSPLRRSGRMDKHIDFELPNFKERFEILKLYMNDKALLKDINIKEVARRTNQFNCADLKTLINETLLQFVSSSKDSVTNEDVYNIIPQIAFKGIKKHKQGEALDYVCYHELGHFICEYVLNNDIPTVSAEKIGNIEGHVMVHSRANRGFYFEEPAESKILSESKCRNSAIISLGGYAAEKIFVGETYTGTLSDFSYFEHIVEMMCRSGMLGSNYLYDFVVRKVGFNGEMYDYQGKGEDIRVKLFDEYLEEANKIINDNKELIEELFVELKAKNKLEPDEIKEIIAKYNKRKESDKSQH